MWISKRKWNEMEEKIKKLNMQIDSLLDIHSCRVKYKQDTFDFGGGYITIAQGHYMNDIKVNTEYIKDVTISELANLVIDGTPITRKETVDVKVEYRGVK